MRSSERTRAGCAVVAMALLLTGCLWGEEKKEKDGGYEEITLAVTPWAGARANAHVAAYLLREQLDVEVEVKELTAAEAWDGLDDGTVHALLEDWRGNLEKEAEYVEKRRSVVEGGDLGVTGHIGWFVPRYFADEHPDIADWENLNKYAADFRAPGTGERGRLLGGEKSWTSYDEHLIRNLDLNFQIEPAANEEALVTEIDKLYAAGKPFLTYWQEPHWKNLEWDLVEVELPEYVEGCNEPARLTDCAYFNTPLQKFFHADFEEQGGAAAEFLRNFRWSNEDQNKVAKLLTADGLSGPEAAEKWAEKNRDIWQRWMP